MAGPEQARILIVSASHYARYVISGELSTQPDLFVVGTARTPEEIVYKKALLRPDLAISPSTNHDRDKTGGVGFVLPQRRGGRIGFCRPRSRRGRRHRQAQPRCKSDTFYTRLDK